MFYISLLLIKCALLLIKYPACPLCFHSLCRLPLQAMSIVPFDPIRYPTLNFISKSYLLPFFKLLCMLFKCVLYFLCRTPTTAWSWLLTWVVWKCLWPSMPNRAHSKWQSFSVSICLPWMTVERPIHSFKCKLVFTYTTFPLCCPN